MYPILKVALEKIRKLGYLPLYRINAPFEEGVPTLYALFRGNRTKAKQNFFFLNGETSKSASRQFETSIFAVDTPLTAW